MKNVIGGFFLGIIGLICLSGALAAWASAVYVISQIELNADRYMVLGMSTFFYAMVGTVIVWLAEPSYHWNEGPPETLSWGQRIALTILTCLYISFIGATLYSWGFELPISIKIS